MSAAIRTSLNRLHGSIQKLEGAVDAKRQAFATVQKRSQTPQSDLFTAQQGGANGVNVRMLATRLDTAINQVEQILKEGRG